MRSLSVIALLIAAALLSACGDAATSGGSSRKPRQPARRPAGAEEPDRPDQRVELGRDPGTRLPEARPAPIEQAEDAVHAVHPGHARAGDGDPRRRRPGAARGASGADVHLSRQERLEVRHRRRAAARLQAGHEADPPTAGRRRRRSPRLLRAAWTADALRALSHGPRAQRRRAVRGCSSVRDARRRALERLAARDATGPMAMTVEVPAGSSGVLLSDAAAEGVAERCHVRTGCAGLRSAAMTDPRRSSMRKRLSIPLLILAFCVAAAGRDRPGGP